jgi:mannitol/fructose-specific phosphotransferase system IIA component (Ntr-type)
VHLTDFLTRSRVAVPLHAADKDELLSALVRLAVPDSVMHDALCEEVRAREAVFPTALGDGVALPHVRTANVESVQLAAGVLAQPLPFGGADGFFLVLSPLNAPSDHLKVLRALSRLLADPEVVTALRTATSVDGFLHTVRQTAPF